MSDKPLFHLGRVVATPGALAVLAKNNCLPEQLLDRHRRGEWGELCEEDKAVNDSALFNGSRILSAYNLPDGSRIWVITDGVIDKLQNRYATTLLLPEEY